MNVFKKSHLILIVVGVSLLVIFLSIFDLSGISTCQKDVPAGHTWKYNSWNGKCFYEKSYVNYNHFEKG